MDLKIYPPEEEMPQGIVTLPSSKSISNRILLLNALSGGNGELDRVAECDDTRVMLNALNSDSDTVNVGAAGTAMRFLTAYFASCEGRCVVIDGSERMRQRPIGILVDALRRCGADIEYVGAEGFPPLKIRGRKLVGGALDLDASVSSQYVSALLMIAPLMDSGLKLTLEGEVVSLPYIKMTLGLMSRWGVECEVDRNVISVPQMNYKVTDFSVEADWSAASYWFEAEALSAGEISLKGLRPDSLQGDCRLMELYRNFGVEAEWGDEGVLDLVPTPDQNPRVDLDLSEQPDLAQAIVVTSCMLGMPFRITGLSTLRIKETDRLTALRDEMRKVSFDIDIVGDSVLEWDGRSRWPVASDRPVVIDTYDDHRMAMAFAPVGLYIPGIVIRDAEVVSKSYPGFWDDMRRLGYCIEEVRPDNAE
ncbi:MAG: 3-phosphoshikimate 1-carboxyvinyltransferase [Muribaculum sp.]|nr:3-phosphoshikimate 1-carboxyvinyltransferase [Muribaculum sp.]